MTTRYTTHDERERQDKITAIVDTLARYGWSATVTTHAVAPFDYYIATAIRGGKVPATDAPYTMQLRTTSLDRVECAELLLTAIQHERLR